MSEEPPGAGRRVMIIGRNQSELALMLARVMADPEFADATIEQILEPAVPPPMRELRAALMQPERDRRGPYAVVPESVRRQEERFRRNR